MSGRLCQTTCTDNTEQPSLLLFWSRWPCSLIATLSEPPTLLQMFKRSLTLYLDREDITSADKIPKCLESYIESLVSSQHGLKAQLRNSGIMWEKIQGRDPIAIALPLCHSQGQIWKLTKCRPFSRPIFFSLSLTNTHSLFLSPSLSYWRKVYMYMYCYFISYLLYTVFF